LIQGSLKAAKRFFRLPLPKPAGRLRMPAFLSDPEGAAMDDTNLDNAFDNLDDALDAFDGITVEGGFNGEDDDSCPGGACKI
jgi:hypothetical protein